MHVFDFEIFIWTSDFSYGRDNQFRFFIYTYGQRQMQAYTAHVFLIV